MDRSGRSGADAELPGEVDAVVVGAGFAGLYMLHCLRGLGMSAVVLEAGHDVGGTWYWNRYPGARCDVESLQYSYAFSDGLQQDWCWSERYAGQPEILGYARHVADRLDLRRDIRFATRVVAAGFDEARERWAVRTDGGAVVHGRFCIMATGCLSTARLPDFPGLETFRGRTFHTGAWPHDGVDFTGQTVGVIGTGSSAIQAIPVIAREAERLIVFQRTPNYSVPAHNGPLAPEVQQAWKARYHEHRQRAAESRNAILYVLNDVSAQAASEAERQRVYEERWQAGGIPFMAAFNDLILDAGSNETAAEFVRAKIRAIVRDPAVAERLTPRGYPIGTKRICVDTDYFATFNRDNVSLVDVREAPIEAITEAGLRTRAASYALDAIVFATGFDAMTGTLLAMDITGRRGHALRRDWAEGPRSYLGLMVAGYPNLFTITGPGSPSVLSNMMVSIEQHVEWIRDCLAHLARRGLATIEPTAEAQDAWVDHVREVGERTLYPRSNSWYVGANVPGKPRVFMPYIGGVPVYRRKCEEVVAQGYAGFRLGSGHAAAAAAT